MQNNRHGIPILGRRPVRRTHRTPIPLPLRRLLTERDGTHCHYCCCRTTSTSGPEYGAPTMRTIDHKLPLSRGGATTLENLVYACLACNNAKGSEDYETFVASQARLATD